MFDLSGLWTLVDAQGQYRCELSLPGDGISALYEAGLIPDPYWGRNELDLRWISEREWVASRSFVLDCADVDLVLSEVDTIATVVVNGKVLLKAENAFRSYRVSLANVAQVGENRIEITFHSPVEAGRALFEAHPFPIPWSWNCPIPYGNFLRKPACDFGWDWNIALAPFGIYGVLRIEPSDAPRIDAVKVRQSHVNGRADLTLVAKITNGAKEATFAIAGQEISTFVVDGLAEVSLSIDAPELWWPAGQGAQPLYDLDVSCGSATAHRRIGLRTMELVTETDGAGLGFKLRVNGRDIFCKGANWIPADALPSRITEAKTRALLQSAVDANMNMVRVWGGGRYEPTTFYDACDELGLMVWQDFMFACNLYPSDSAFLENVTSEVIENVTRLHHHASLALWCGDNELVGALTWYDESRADRDRYLVNYDRLNRTIENALRDADPTANWWPSSPSPGPLSFGDAWHDDSSGDMHFWSVWHEGKDFEHYRDVAPRFCSEFGFQSYPSMDQVRTFAAPDDMNIAAPTMESHQKNPGGNARIAETMFRYFRFPNTFENFVYVSQVQQALAIKTAVTHWRGLTPHCMGTLIWQLNDTWPVASWSSLDYGGGWKLLHHAIRDFYQPVTVIAVPVDGAVTLRAINDEPEEIEVTLSAQAVLPDGTRRNAGTASGNVGANPVDLMKIDGLAEQEMLLFVWETSDGRSGSDLVAPKPFKSYDLRPADVALDATRTESHVRLTLESRALALFVAVEADVPGRFDRNGLTLLPDDPVTLTFVPEDHSDTPNFTLRDLHSATT